MPQNMYSSLLSGMFAAFACVSGKYAFNEELELPSRFLSLVALFLSNALMLQFFVKGMREAGSVIGTTLNVFSNIIVSTILGVLLFDECSRLTKNWYLGATLAVLGVFCLSKGQQEKEKND